MKPTEFLTIVGSYGNLEVVQKTLPSVIEESKANDARLIVHDSTEARHGQDEKWSFLRELEREHGFFLILSTNMSMAHARNMCLKLGQEMFLPSYIAIMEDDHGYRPGLIDALTTAMKQYYGVLAPNKLRFGMFTGCGAHRHGKTSKLEGTNHCYIPIVENTPPMFAGGTNSCFRAAPSHHWDHVLKGYDTDEYLISTHQTKNLNFRNYHKGFTSMLVEDGNFMFDLDHESRGWDENGMSGLWDDEYTASDPRSNYRTS